MFAYLLEKLQATPDGDGTLLDHVTLMYGTGMGDSNAHDPRNIPLLLAGGGAGQLKGGRHIRYPKETPLANLHLTLLDKLGVHARPHRRQHGHGSTIARCAGTLSMPMPPGRIRRISRCCRCDRVTVGRGRGRRSAR